MTCRGNKLLATPLREGGRREEEKTVSAGPSCVAVGLFLPLSSPAQEAGRGTQAGPEVCSDFQLGWILETTNITSGYIVGLSLKRLVSDE